jgi:hypothetical protein
MLCPAYQFWFDATLAGLVLVLSFSLPSFLSFWIAGGPEASTNPNPCRRIRPGYKRCHANSLDISPANPWLPAFRLAWLGD